MTIASLTLKVGEARRAFYFREKTSDEGVITQVFREQQYAIHNWQRAQELSDLIERRRVGNKRPLIVDAGANIGASVVYFAGKIPSARIVAIEPAVDNFDLLKRNSVGLDVDLRLAALGANAGRARIVDPGIGPWGYRTESAEENQSSVPVLSIGDIYRAYDRDYFPFLAKLDIEGEEKEVFSQNTQWVRQTPIIIVEPHDWMLPKQNTVRSFLRLMAEESRDIIIQGENIVAISQSLE